jgi:hypothetical protein
MNLKEVLSISGMSGLYKMVANRDNGLIVVALGDDKRKFVPSRQHMFTPLENITIYTDDEPVELTTVLLEMKKQTAKNPLVSANASGAELRGYFTKIVPNHDTEKVYTSDIKKVLKWYEQLDKENMLVEEKAEEVVSKEEKPKKEAKPKAPAKTKAVKSTDAKPKAAAGKQAVTRQKK